MMEIENLWCIRKGVMHFPMGIGKIEEEGAQYAMVRYSEGQLFPLQAWNKEYLERFATFQEMVEKFAEYERTSVASETKRFFESFPLLRASASENVE